MEPLEARRLLAIDLPAVLDIDGNRNGVLEVAEIEALSQSLDSGTYVFARLDSGEYLVRVAPDPVGQLEPNETAITLNFRGSVSGFKWNDQNGDGVRQTGEPGVGGVRIYADLDSDGAFDAGEPFTLTLADGAYRLVLNPGLYAIREVAPAGTVQTFPFDAQQAIVPLVFAGETLSADLSSGHVLGNQNSAWHNADQPADVNADGRVNVVDALDVVGELRFTGSRPLPDRQAGEGEGDSDSHHRYVDVNSDGMLSVADLVGVVEVLRGEGEPTAQNDRFGLQTPDPYTVGSNTEDNVLPVLANDTGQGRLTLTRLGTLEGGLVGPVAVGDHGGRIEVQSGGAQAPDVILYTPAPDFYGVERFIYEVRDEADGTTDTAEVLVNAIPDRDYARFTFQAFQPDGVTPVTSVERGQQFIVRVFVKDERENFTPTSQRGVFSAYLDLMFDEGRLDLVPIPPNANPHGFSRDVRFGPDYQELVSIDNFLPGLIDEAGATQTEGFDIDTQPLGPNAIPFFDARFLASETGTVTFTGNPADVPEHQFVFFRPSNLEPLNQAFVDYVPLDLTIAPAMGAVPDSFTRNEDLEGPAGSELANPVLDLLANDLPFVAGQPLRIVGLGPNDAATIATNAGGTVEIINNGQAVRYTPPENFSGIDFFNYRASDGQSSDTTVVSITLLPLNDAPVANDDAFVADNQAMLTVIAPGVLGNDVDADDDPLSVSAFDAVSALGAQVSVNPNGRFTYNPLTSPELQNIAPGEVLIDTFTYTVTDGRGATDTATVRVFVSLNTAGAHVVEILPGRNSPGANFGNRSAGGGALAGEAELEDAIDAIVRDLTT